MKGEHVINAEKQIRVSILCKGKNNQEMNFEHARREDPKIADA